MDNTRFAVWDYTYVEYVEEDPLSKLLAIVGIAPVFIIVGLLTLCFFSTLRKANVNLLLGLIVNEVTNRALKNAIRQPRPPREGRQVHSFGMPSSHSQFICFFAAFTVPAIVFSRHYGFWCKVLRCALVLVLAGLTVVGRMYLQYHTGYQVIVGSALGTLIGASWYSVSSYHSKTIKPKKH